MGLAAAMLVGVGVPGSDRVVPLPVFAAEQAVDQAGNVLAEMRKALGGSKLEEVKGLTLEGPFRREMGPRQIEGTMALTLVGPDKMHKSEDNEFPGGMSVERIQALNGDTSWTDIQNRGGMGGAVQIMMRDGPPGAPGSDPAAAEQRRTNMFRSEMQRWMFALLAQTPGEVIYAGVAESPDGKADTLEIKDVRGHVVRLFVDQETHLPLMLAYQEIRPRIMMAGGPGGRGRRGRGPGPDGPGAPGAPGSGTGGGPGGRPDPEEMRRRMESMPPPPPSAMQMRFDEYDTVDGVKLPRRIAISADGAPVEEWTVEKIKVNPTVKADFFTKK
jgi:hypothetical protein